MPSAMGHFLFNLSVCLPLSFIGAKLTQLERFVPAAQGHVYLSFVGTRSRSYNSRSSLIHRAARLQGYDNVLV
jgi:hypothetical protein